jgi:hypothetical protein
MPAQIETNFYGLQFHTVKFAVLFYRNKAPMNMTALSTDYERMSGLMKSGQI